MKTFGTIIPKGNNKDDGEILPRKKTPQPTKEKVSIDDRLMGEVNQIYDEDLENNNHPILIYKKECSYISPDNNCNNNTNVILNAILFLAANNIVMLDGQMFNYREIKSFITRAEHLCDRKCDSDRIKRFSAELLSVLKNF